MDWSAGPGPRRFFFTKATYDPLSKSAFHGFTVSIFLRIQESENPKIQEILFSLTLLAKMCRVSGPEFDLIKRVFPKLCLLGSQQYRPSTMCEGVTSGTVGSAAGTLAKYTHSTQNKQIK